jgi:hypothetical protein
VLLLDVPQFDAATAQRPTTPREDRAKQVEGLEQLAGATRGGLYRINVTADYAFDRISHTLDGYYLLGVESRQAIGTAGATTSASGPTAGRSVRSRDVHQHLGEGHVSEDAINRAMRSPLPVNDLPPGCRRDLGAGTNKTVSCRRRSGAAADQSLDYTVARAREHRGRACAGDGEAHVEGKLGEPAPLSTR